MKVKCIVLDNDNKKARDCVENFVLELQVRYNELCNIKKDIFTSLYSNELIGYSFKRTNFDSSQATFTTVTTPYFTYKFIISNKIEAYSEELQEQLLSDNLEAPAGIIYLDLDLEQKGLIDMFREKSSLIAIDFYAMNCTYKECLESISQLLNQNEHKSALVL